jgi:hypothetical protein
MKSFNRILEIFLLFGYLTTAFELQTVQAWALNSNTDLSVDLLGYRQPTRKLYNDKQYVNNALKLREVLLDFHSV